jgi:hypothetical protein
MAYIVIDRNVMSRRREWYSPALGLACGGAAYALLTIGLLLGVIEIMRV